MPQVSSSVDYILNFEAGQASSILEGQSQTNINALNNTNFILIDDQKSKTVERLEQIQFEYSKNLEK